MPFLEELDTVAPLLDLSSVVYSPVDPCSRFLDGRADVSSQLLSVTDEAIIVA